MDIKFENKLIIEVEKNTTTRIAAYLYKYKECIEKKSYHRNHKVAFDFFDHNTKNGIYSIKVFFKNGSDITSEMSNSFYFNKNNEICYINREELIDSENFLIESYSQDSDIVFVTFNATGSTKRTKPFATDFIVKNGWDCIAVYQDNDTQYQYLSEDKLREVVAPYLKEKKVFTYGSSLGGYCAVYYAGILNAVVIAASPKNSAHPSIRIKKFLNLDFQHKDIYLTHKTHENVYIIYDPSLAADVSFIQNQVITHYPCAKLLPIAKGTHAVLNRVLSLGYLSKLIFSIVNDNYFGVYNEIISKNHNSR